MNSSRQRFIDRTIVILTTLIAATVAVFVATRPFAATNDVTRQPEGAARFAIGDAALRGDDLRTAIPSFRRAAARHPDNAAYRRSLAATLMANHDDAETNLQFARLPSRGDRTAARRCRAT